MRKVWKKRVVLPAMAAAIALVAGPAYAAATKVQGNMVEHPLAAIGDYNFKDGKEGKGKVQFQSTTKEGEGGFKTKLLLKDIDCPATGNDQDKEGKCGVKDSPVGGILEFNILVLGAVEIQSGSQLDIEKGKAVFRDTGKNQTNAGAQGASVSTIFNTSVGFSEVYAREPGSDEDDPSTGCDGPPLSDPSTCVDGNAFAMMGIIWGEDPLLICTTTDDCDDGSLPTLICTGGLCGVEPCTVDADCDQDGGGSGGTGACNESTGMCCNPATSTDPECDGPSPSGAFLDGAAAF